LRHAQVEGKTRFAGENGRCTGPSPSLLTTASNDCRGARQSSGGALTDEVHLPCHHDLHGTTHRWHSAHWTIPGRLRGRFRTRPIVDPRKIPRALLSERSSRDCTGGRAGKPSPFWSVNCPLRALCRVTRMGRAIMIRTVAVDPPELLPAGFRSRMRKEEACLLTLCRQPFPCRLVLSRSPSSRCHWN
jgi:hypothetical protein